MYSTIYWLAYIVYHHKNKHLGTEQLPLCHQLLDTHHFRYFLSVNVSTMYIWYLHNDIYGTYVSYDSYGGLILITALFLELTWLPSWNKGFMYVCMYVHIYIYIWYLHIYNMVRTYIYICVVLSSVRKIYILKPNRTSC